MARHEPDSSAPHTSMVVPSKVGLDAKTTTSSGVRGRYPGSSTSWATLAWVTTTPLGRPVEPDVNRM